MYQNCFFDEKKTINKTRKKAENDDQKQKLSNWLNQLKTNKKKVPSQEGNICGYEYEYMNRPRVYICLSFEIILWFIFMILFTSTYIQQITVKEEREEAI